MHFCSTISQSWQAVEKYRTPIWCCSWFSNWCSRALLVAPTVSLCKSKECKESVPHLLNMIRNVSAACSNLIGKNSGERKDTLNEIHKLLLEEIQFEHVKITQELWQEERFFESTFTSFLKEPLSISVTACAWGHHSPLKLRANYSICSGVPLWATAYTQMTRCMQDFPTKSKYDIIRAPSGDTLMMWGFLDDDIYVMVTSGLEGIKGWMQGEEVPSSQFQGFRCRAYMAKLITSRVLQFAHTLDQPGILHLLTTEMCSLSTPDWCLLQSSFCFIDLGCLSDHHTNGPSQKS